MVKKATLEINNFGPINEAKIDINRINIIGGANSTGKSTSSKLLYCFLKANSSDRRYLAYSIFEEKYRRIIELLDSEAGALGLKSVFKNNFPLQLCNMYAYCSYLDLVKLELFNNQVEDDELTSDYDDNLVYRFLEGYKDLSHRPIGFNHYGEYSFNVDFEFKLIKCELQSVPGIDDLDSDVTDEIVYDTLFNRLLEKYDELKEFYFSDAYHSFLAESFEKEINKTINSYEKCVSEFDKYYETCEKDWENNHKDNGMSFDEYRSKFCEPEFSHREAEGVYILINFDDFADTFYDMDYIEDIINLFPVIVSDYSEKSFIQDSILSAFNDLDSFINSYKSDSEDYFEFYFKKWIESEFIEYDGHGSVKLYDSTASKFSLGINFEESSIISEGWFDIENVVYLDSFSILDIMSNKDKWDKFNLNHIKAPDYSFDNEDKKTLLKIIESLIGGYKDSNYFVTSNYSCPINNVASGIKQILILQEILSDKLSSNSVLIMDEPEVNLHPEWQIKLAEILVLIAKKLDVVLYINSHSPIFIEAMDTYADIYDLSDDVSYYLTEESDNPYLYDFVNINNDELCILYDNLGNPYDILDNARLTREQKF